VLIGQLPIVQVREWAESRLRIERRPHRSGDATAQVEELDGEPAITSTAASAPKPVDVANDPEGSV
jgi:hypothetical protein